VIRHVEHIGSWNIDAGMDASQTHDTSIEPLFNQGGTIVYGRMLHRLWRKFIGGDAKLIDTILKLTLASCITDRAVERVIDQKEFQSL
jgi:hypothetical protein